ncbi:MAG: DNA replication and repair protein RecF [Chlorobi bacterium]|nr:DNA replication and repair protein RecF [Chlorobiota bacterium]
MVVEQIVLSNFRCYQQYVINFDGRSAVITGPNGAGKTSILEALHILAITKSFLPVDDSELIRHSSSTYRIESTVLHDGGSTIKIAIEYTKGIGKSVYTSITDSCSAQELIGLVPCVVLASLHKELFYGEPAVRRAFVDRILSQYSLSYKSALWRYRIALKQRNRLLQEGGSATNAELDAWTVELVNTSVELLWQRKLFVDLFNQELSLIAASIAHPSVEPMLQYTIPWLPSECQPNTWGSFKDNLFTIIANHSTAMLATDSMRQSTQWGPQRDIFTFATETHPLYTVLSQGQLKIMLFAIKITEATILHQQTGRAPILLLDDVFSDLDKQNTASIQESVAKYSAKWQFFITAPSSIEILDPMSTFMHIQL